MIVGRNCMTLRGAATMKKCFRACLAGSVNTDLTRAVRPRSQQMQRQATDSRDSHSTSLRQPLHFTEAFTSQRTEACCGSCMGHSVSCWCTFKYGCYAFSSQSDLRKTIKKNQVLLDYYSCFHLVNRRIHTVNYKPVHKNLQSCSFTHLNPLCCGELFQFFTAGMLFLCAAITWWQSAQIQLHDSLTDVLESPRFAPVTLKDHQFTHLWMGLSLLKKSQIYHFQQWITFTAASHILEKWSLISGKFGLFPFIPIFSLFLLLWFHLCPFL